MRRFVEFFIAIVLIVAGALVLWYAVANPAPRIEAQDSVYFTDLADRKVPVRQPVRRIVLPRSRDVYELMILLGDELPDKLVGWGQDLQTYDRDAYDKFVKRYPRLADVPIVGSLPKEAVSVEKVFSLKPDLIIVEGLMPGGPSRNFDAMEQAGLPLFFLDFSTRPCLGPQKSVLQLGKVIGKEDRAREIYDFVNAEQEKVFSRLAKIDKPIPSVYIEAGDQGPGKYSATYGSTGDKTCSWGSIMNQLRCRNVIGDAVSGLAPINPEYLLKADPDVIIITGAYWPAADAMRLGYCAEPESSRKLLHAFTERPGWSELKAVKNHRVYALFHGFSMHTTNFAAVQQLAKWLYPEEFKDLDPLERLKEFHRRFMPVDCSGVWMIALDDNK